MSSVFDTVKLSKSDTPFTIPKNLTDLDSFEFDGLEGKTNLREMLDSSYTDAFVILKDSKIIFEEYQNENKYCHHIYFLHHNCVKVENYQMEYY